MNLVLLSQWWNLAFLIPFSFGVLLLLMQAVGLVGKDFELSLEQEAHLELEADAEIEVDADVDLEVEADVDLELDADVDVDVDADAEVELEADADLDADVEAPAHSGTTDVELVADAPARRRRQGLGMRALVLVGVGRAPISVIAMNLCFSWGFFGMALNSWLQPVLVDPARFFPASVAGTALLSVATTGLTSRLLGKYMPTLSTFSTLRVEVVGRVGTSLYSVRADRGGTVRVADQHGNLQQYSAFLGPDTEEIPGDTPVILLRYDEDRGAFEVEVAPEELRP